MTEEQQHLLETVENTLSKYKEVGELFASTSDYDEIASKIKDFFNSFKQLQQAYSSITNGDEVEEVEKSNKSVWSDLFSNMENGKVQLIELVK